MSMNENVALQDIKRALKRVQGLQHVTSELSKANTKSSVAKVIIEEGFLILGAESGDVVLMDDGGNLEVVAYKGYPKSVLEGWSSAGKAGSLITHEVIQRKKPYFIPDANQIDEKYAYAKYFLGKVKAQSAALLPLIQQNKIVGVIQFTFSRPQIFEEEDKKFMITLAQQCSQAFERVTAQEKLAESKKELEIILSTVADGILVQDDTGGIIYANKAVGNVFKDVKYEDFFTYKWEDFLNQFEVQDEQGNILSHSSMPGRRAITSRKPTKVTYKFTHKKSQESHWLQIESTALVSLDKKSSIAVSVFQDITTLKEIEQRKDDFISIASHELKTPLTSAKVFTQVLKKQFISKKLKDEERLVNKIDRQLEQLNELTKDLLDITKIQKGKLELTKTRFALDKIVGNVVGDLQPSTDHRIEISQNERVMLYADKEKIAQVITNFLTNAIKYSPSTQKIDIKIFKNATHVKVSVKDRGIGIARHDVEKIFERFYRIERDKKTYPGLGLGLYISSEIIRQHGGDIGVKSEKGQGSIFYFSLPLSSQSKNN